MKVDELGESGLIRLLTDMITGSRTGPGNATAFGMELTVDVGDDAAGWKLGGITELHTTDTIVEGVHFTRTTTPWEDLGWKLMAANVSDIAAMGGSPLHALITLGIPPEEEVGSIESLYRGALKLGNKYGVRIIGGDVVRSPVFFATVALAGGCEGEPMRRSSARPGDHLAVTGELGSSAGGLRILSADVPVRDDVRATLSAAHRRPQPRTASGQLLRERGVRAAMDISDGLVEDLTKLCLASGVAARVESELLPVNPHLREAFPDGYTQLALAGGEDYELLFAAPPSLMDGLRSLLPDPTTVVGEVVAGEAGTVTVVDSRTGQTIATPTGGWDHFGSSAEGPTSKP